VADDHAMLDRVVAEVERRGLTGEGADYVVKALYPPWNRTGVFMPSDDARPGIVFDSRETKTIGRGPSCPATSNWDCMVVAHSGEQSPVFVIRGEAGVDFAANVKPATAESNPVYITTSIATTPIPVFFRNTGSTLVAANIAWPRSLPVSARNVAKSLTVHLAASALNNGGVVTAGQLPGCAVAGAGIGWDSAPATYPSTGSFFWSPSNSMVPSDEIALSNMCPAVYSGPAREGIFAINRMYPNFDGNCSGSDYRGKMAVASTGALNANLLAFDAQPDVSSEGTPWPFMPFRYMYSCTTVNSAYTLPWWTLLVNPDGGFNTSIIGDSDCTTTVAYFRGLAPEATLQFNLFSSVQMALQPGSLYAALAKRPPRADPRALEVYSVLSAKLDDAYPARCNSLALLAPFLLQAVKSIMPMVTRAVPAVGRYAGMIAPIADVVAQTFREGERAGEARPTRARKVRANPKPSSAPKARPQSKPRKLTKRK